MIETPDRGPYRAAETPLHGLDPRLKIFAALVVVMHLFAAASWPPLLVAAALVALAIRLAGPVADTALRGVWMLRWLLPAILAMHLLLSPGRTLWGVSWLSYDGFLSGVLVCVQLALAAGLASLVAATTRVAELAGAFAWFVRPLNGLGCRTEEWSRLFALALNFLPLVRAEMRNAADCDAPLPDGRGWAAWTGRFEAFVDRLVARGDVVAHQLADGSLAEPEQTALPPLLPLARYDLAALALLLATIFCYWIAR